MIIQPYVNFDGRCDEAIDFYKKTLGAKVEKLLRFKDNPEPPSAECAAQFDPDKVMHAQLQIGNSVIMASDSRSTGNPDFKGISLALILKDEAEVDRSFSALADGGDVQMPLDRTFFSRRFGMVTDRFGVCWMILVKPK